MSHDALVIGGGPAGAAAAIALARGGLRTALIEKSAFPRRKVCGEYLSAASIPVLERLGVADAWAAAAGPRLRRVGLFAGERIVTARMPAGPGHGRALGRDVLDGLLIGGAIRSGVEVFQPWLATGLETAPGGHVLRIASDSATETLCAPIVVAAHGSWERGPLRTQPPRRNGPSDLLGFKAYFRGGCLDADLMPMLAFPGGYGGLVRADGGRLSVSCCLRRDVLSALRSPGESAGAAVHRHLALSCRGVREALDGAELLGPWLAAGPIRPGLRPCYAGDIFRVGNLAGEAHPVIAEGISMALQSGWMLGRELARIDPANARDRALAGSRHARAWNRQFATRIRAAKAFAQIAMRPRTFAGIAALAGTMPGTLTLGARLSGKSKSVMGQL